jgi:hypothetical protein
MNGKRFTIRDGFLNGLYTIDDAEQEYVFSTINDKDKLICFTKALNHLYEENINLRKALWEAESDYIYERYEYSFEIEQELNELKKEFERQYWNYD